MKTLIIHPWSQTILDADDGVIVVNVTDEESTLDDSQLVAIAQKRGLAIPSHT